jgi:hypothetical protein
MTQRASGTFEVKLQPLDAYNQGEGANGRMSIDKQFSGDLIATSCGEMLSLLDRSIGSGGYVAMERVTGTLNGRHGSFALQHSATMRRGEPHLHILVVPDSGSGDLLGLAGTMNILVMQGQHAYEFDYTLPASDS